jgi:hypothetical protein
MQHIKKTLLTLVTLLFHASTISSQTNGTCGANAYWAYSNGNLTISGTGKMADYDGSISLTSAARGYYYQISSGEDTPWEAYKESITSLVIEEGITYIGNFAFYGCIHLAAITFPCSVTTVGTASFMQCSSLSTVFFPTYQSTTVGSFAFSDCTNLVSFTGSISTIKDNAFRNCFGLVSFTNRGLLSPPKFRIGDPGTMFPNVGLEGITLYVPASLIDDYQRADEWRKFGKISATPVIGQEVVDTQGQIQYRWTFFDGTLDITANDGWTNMDHTGTNGTNTPGTRWAWSDYKEQITTVILRSGTTKIGEDAFKGCTYLKSVSLPEGIVKIEDRAFSECVNLEFLTLPASVKSIGFYSFYDCRSLKEFSLPDKVETIGECAFAYCSALTSLTLPSSIKSLGIGVFIHCSGITSLFISNIKLIEVSSWVTTFENCTGLTSVTCLIPKPPGLFSVFRHVNLANVKLYVLPQSVHAYQAANEWKSFGSIEPLYTDIEALNRAKIIIENQVYTIPQTAANTQEDVQKWLTEQLNTIPGISTLDIQAIIPSDIVLSGFTAAANGVGGSFDFTVSLSKNDASASATIKGSISATPGQEGSCGPTLKWTFLAGILTIRGEGQMNNYNEYESPWYPIRAAITRLIIEENVASLGRNAFFLCSNLTSVVNESPTPQEIDSEVFSFVPLSGVSLYVPSRSTIEDYQSAPVWASFGKIGESGVGDPEEEEQSEGGKQTEKEEQVEEAQSEEEKQPEEEEPKKEEEQPEKEEQVEEEQSEEEKQPEEEEQKKEEEQPEKEEQVEEEQSEEEKQPEEEEQSKGIPPNAIADIPLRSAFKGKPTITDIRGRVVLVPDVNERTSIRSLPLPKGVYIIHTDGKISKVNIR